MAHENDTDAEGRSRTRPCGLLDLVSEIASLANMAEDVDEPLGLALDRIVEYMDWQVGATWMARPDGRFMMIHHRHNGASPRVKAFLESDDEIVFDPGAEAIRRRPGSAYTPLVADISRTQTLSRTRDAAEVGMRTAMLVPISIGRRICAGMEFYTSERVTVEPGLVRALDQIAMHLARVIERQQAQAELDTSRAHNAKILDTATDAFLSMSSSGRITAWNHTAEEMFGWSAEEVIGRTLSEFIVPPRLREVHNRRVRKILETGEVEPSDRRSNAFALRRSGHEFPAEVTRWVMKDSESSYLCAFIRDLSEQKAFEEQLRLGSRLDPLTHLYNRTHLIDELCQILDRRVSHYGSVAVLFADIDQFRLINESLGHDVGDEVLVAVAARFAAALDDGDVIGRISADEFVIVRQNVGSGVAGPGVEMELLAQRLIESLAEPIQLIDDTVFVSASIGITFPEGRCAGCNPSNAERLVYAANQAMRHARSTGTGYHQQVEAVRCSDVPVRRHIASDLRRALDQGEFRVHFQPEVRISDGRTGGVEALLRWMHPEHGLQAPASFMEALEESGLIVPVGRWVMEQTVAHALEWQNGVDPSVAPLNVWVNVSTRQFAQSDLVATINEVVVGAGLDPTRIRFGIELTESSLMNNPEHALTTLHQLSDMGILFAIDDFGTGYSSLAYLKHFPATTLKIDRSFILGIADHDIDRSIVEGVVGLARSLGLEVVAEGVENREQLKVLEGLGVDLAQGYLFSKPRSARTITEELLAPADRGTVLRAIPSRNDQVLVRPHVIGS